MIEVNLKKSKLIKNESGSVFASASSGSSFEINHSIILLHCANLFEAIV